MNALSNEITCDASAPPMGITNRTPSSSEAPRIKYSGDERQEQEHSKDIGGEKQDAEENSGVHHLLQRNVTEPVKASSWSLIKAMVLPRSLPSL